ncbi:PAS domain-containing protein [Bradyrhizobium sp. LHD-71]|uniref:PAS domain-containing protein n=1 Tax=Bradyrhizobium sp. LHD-71 TaxID=3072141 RepID=UPI00280F5C42|nr:PAS domain-containing protein [Bradyrhizobium sp. LHD-71]MDQ8726564.1 PAS domain-containing protein [Bradyrhizobium sp. LHD-71]
MKHPATRELYDYWDKQRAGAPAPDRGAMEPGPIRHLIGNTFVVSCDHPSCFPLRVAGTRVCAMIGRDIKGDDFLHLWAPASRRQVEDFLSIATEECLATAAGVTAFTDELSPVHLELLLLPFAPSMLAPQCVTGSLVPLTLQTQFERSGLHDLSLTSWRHAGHQPRTLRQRAVRRLALARGFMAYEGLRGD